MGLLVSLIKGVPLWLSMFGPLYLSYLPSVIHDVTKDELLLFEFDLGDYGLERCLIGRINLVTSYGIHLLELGVRLMGLIVSLVKGDLVWLTMF